MLAHNSGRYLLYLLNSPIQAHLEEKRELKSVEEGLIGKGRPGIYRPPIISVYCIEAGCLKCEEGAIIDVMLPDNKQILCNINMLLEALMRNDFLSKIDLWWVTLDKLGAIIRRSRRSWN